MTTVRLDPKTRAALERLASDRGQTRSEVIRDAIHRMAEGAGGSGGGETALDRLAPFIGVADGGDPDLSRDAGRRFREILQTKSDARRSG